MSGTRWRRAYGSSPLHLLGLLASFAAIVYVVGRLLARASLGGVLTWFVGALVVHDLGLFWLYTALDRAGVRLTARRAGSLGPGVVNYLRAPALVSALLGFVYCPSILRLNAAAYRRATGLTPDAYLGRWLALSAALFAGSALVLAVRIARRAAVTRRC